jgi:DNA-directed RNA polymerase specialized sigma24 family protein
VDAYETAEATGLDQLELLLRQRFFDGLVRQLRVKFSNLGSSDVEDAVAGAVESLVKRLSRRPVSGDLRAYLSKSAFNEARRAARRRTRGLECPLDERDDSELPSTEDDALRTAGIEMIKAEVRSWENANVREVTLVYVEALVEGELLDTEEVAEIVSTVLGEEINPNSVRTWKARGLRKLQQFVNSTDGFDMRPDLAAEKGRR